MTGGEAAAALLAAFFVPVPEFGGPKNSGVQGLIMCVCMRVYVYADKVVLMWSLVVTLLSPSRVSPGREIRARQWEAAAGRDKR